MAKLDRIGAGIAVECKRARMAPLALCEDRRMYDVRFAKRPLSLLLVLGIFGSLSLGSDAALASTLPHFWPPPILGDIRCDDWRGCGNASRAFTSVLRNNFPVGTRGDVLQAELLKQGFHHLPSSITKCLPRGELAPIGVKYVQCPAWDANWNPRNDLVYGWGWFPCGSQVGVAWSEDRNGKISHIEGYYDYTCL
jgi:hypothetical protein